MLAKAVKLGERIGAYHELAMSSVFLAASQEQSGFLEESVSTFLKALEYCKKIGGVGPIDLILAGLVRLYAKLGNSEAAEEHYWKLLNLPPKAAPVDIKLTQEGEVVRAQAIFFASRNQWNEASEYFEKAFENAKRRTAYSNVFLRKDYAWALSKQGRTQEAKVLLEENQNVTEEIEKRFAHVNVHGRLIVPWKVVVGEEFEMRLDLVNVSRKPGFLVKAEGLIPGEFEVTASPAQFTVEKGSVDMKGRVVKSFQVETIKLKVKALKHGAFTLDPQVSYVDELGEAKTCKPAPITITVQPAQPKYEVLPGRVSTGLEDLDSLLFGGIPQNYAVALTSASTDEREMLVKRFLEAGSTAGEITFHITSEAANTKVLTEKYPSNFYLFVCNPQADAMVQDLPNVFKLKGVENLTDIDIALTRAFRTLNPSAVGPKRICIEIVSDALLQHHAVTTRRWLSALLPTLKSKDFTILAVLDPQMHPAEETQAVLGLFEGEINIYEKETPKGTARFLKIKRMTNQKYLKDERLLTEE